MKIYLAAPYALRNALRAYADDLENRGHECTSSWLMEQKPITSASVGNAASDDDTEAQRHVDQDMNDVFNSDALVVVTWRQTALLDPFAVAYVNSGGRHVEFGMALAWRKQLVVWGPESENIFHRDNRVQLATSWGGVRKALGVI